MSRNDNNPSGGKLGTFAGVFTPSILTILGIVLFLRMGYVVGNAGLARALEIILLANLVSILTTFSLAAIATNFQVKSGGDYYLISRTLGLGFGGAIGIVLYLAQSVSIGFYCVGLGEAVAALMPGEHPLMIHLVAIAAIALLFALAWGGLDWATRFQYAIMALMGVALLSFAFGASWSWNSTTLAHNWGAGSAGGPGFWLLFAIFFPAATGFTQGVSMSGDLRDPGRSIPPGTFIAVGVSFVIYIAAAVLLAGAQERAVLTDDYAALKKAAAIGWLVDVGIVAAALSSALASFLGAPRILQALARDRIVPGLHVFAKGYGANANPRRAVVLSALIALAVAALGDLNAVAAIVSMFFLASYALMNYATWYEARAASPSFRPTFKWYHPYLSLAGLLVCVVSMLAISPTAALAAIVFIAAIFYLLKLSGAAVRWSDSQRSHHLQRVREHLLAAAGGVEHPRDWRPYLLAFSDSAERRAPLLRLAGWLEGGSGMTTVVRILVGEGALMLKQRDEALEELRRELRELHSPAFPLVVSAPSVELAVPLVIQAAGTGPIQNNTVLLNWLDDSAPLMHQFSSSRYGQNLRTAFRLGANLLILSGERAAWEHVDNTPAADRGIDVWWQADAAGELMLLLAYLMTRSPQWRYARIRVLVGCPAAPTEETLAQARRLVATARIDAEVVAVAHADSAAIASHCGDAALVFMNFFIRNGQLLDPCGGELRHLLPQLRLAVLTMAARNIDLDAQPDEGLPAQLAVARDALAAAARRCEKARKLEAEAQAALARANNALGEGITVGEGPSRMAELHAQLAAAEVAATEAARKTAKENAKRDNARQALLTLEGLPP